ncbi:hemerythrin domain-containing protein [uncultured Tissierella sp.]|jgi:regulator of cell morphogenesis and NO signaling|uniref:hemerythrin domain-containing protein n=1 Tax=uncultured Tissierella sp. TaxID=448160 RepID=UPI0028052005|nr:hemerythrin domain-containing protein [uncultured Tissierella sp.]MDU5080703.1 hemerythrin domain-containing protein [Bacillota bacterium]
MTNFHSQEIDLNTEKYSQIIEYILKKHHTPLKKELPELEKLVYTIFKVHFDDSGDVLEKVHRLFGGLKTVLESHIIKEERKLFYMIIDYEKEPSQKLLENIVEEIENVEKDNKELEGLVKKIREITNDYLVPPTGCPTYVNTYDRLKELEIGLLQHIDIENNIMFYRLKKEANKG